MSYKSLCSLEYPFIYMNMICIIFVIEFVCDYRFVLSVSFICSLNFAAYESPSSALTLIQQRSPVIKVSIAFYSLGLYFCFS